MYTILAKFLKFKLSHTYTAVFQEKMYCMQEQTKQCPQQWEVEQDNVIYLWKMKTM